MEVDDLKQKLKESNLALVSRQTGLTRQTLYNFLDNKNTKLESLQLLDKYFNDTNEAELYSALTYFGAPLNVKKQNPNKSLENTLALGLEHSRQDSLVASVMPYVLYKQRTNLDLYQLYRLAVKSDSDQLLGYFLEVANAYSNFKLFSDFSKNIFQFNKYKSNTLKKLNGKSVKSEYVPLYSSNKLALKWGFLESGTLEHHLERYSKWDKSVKS